MNLTGVHANKGRSSLLRLSGCGLALAAIVLGVGSSSFAEQQDLTKPRVERVRDTDGSVWEVQIVPLTIYQPKPICPLPAAQMNLEPAKTSLVPPAPAKKAAAPKATKAKAAVKEAPAKADKATELVSFQDNKADKKPMKKKDDKAKKKKADESPFGVDIVPRFAPPNVEGACPPVSGCGHVHPGDYMYVYSSIPFLRSEYIANPSYRHEATMEILFGQLRPTVVHKHPGQPRPHHTMFPFENDIIRPYSYYSLAPGAGYARGPLPFAAPGAYGVNYNFYYPMPTIYRAY